MKEEQNPGKLEGYEAPHLTPEQARAEQARIRERLEEQARRAVEKQHHTNHEHLKHHAEKKAEQTEDIAERLRETVEQRSQTNYGYESADTIPRAVSQARKQLKPAEQKLSKFIHNSKVEKVSEVTGATIARPSGLLWGSLFSFIGTLAFYVTSLVFGYEYNAFVAIIAFVGGFGLGLILELFSRKLRTD